MTLWTMVSLLTSVLVKDRDIAVHSAGLGSCYVSIRGYGKVIVPGTTDRSIGVTNGDGCRGIVADHRIGSTDPDTGVGLTQITILVSTEEQEVGGVPSSLKIFGLK